MNEQLREEGCRWGQDSAPGLVSGGTDAWLWVGNRAELWMKPSGTSLPRSWEKKTAMNELDLVTDPRWRGKRRQSCPWPNLSMVPQHPVQAGAQKGLYSYAHIEGCLWGFDLGVQENSHVSSAWNNLKGKGPSHPLGGGWSWYRVTVHRHRWVPGLCAVWMSGDTEMASSGDPWKPQHVRELQISEEAALRRKGTKTSGRWKKWCR